MKKLFLFTILILIITNTNAQESKINKDSIIRNITSSRLCDYSGDHSILNLGAHLDLIPIKKRTRMYSIFDSSIIEIISKRQENDLWDDFLYIDSQKIIELKGSTVSWVKDNKNLIICTGIKDSTFVYGINLKRRELNYIRSYKSIHNSLISLSSEKISYFDEEKKEIVILENRNNISCSIKFSPESEFASSSKLDNNLYLIETGIWQGGFYDIQYFKLNLKTLEIFEVSDTFEEFNNYSSNFFGAYVFGVKDLFFFSMNKSEDKYIQSFLSNNSFYDPSNFLEMNCNFFSSDYYLGYQSSKDSVEYLIFGKRINDALFGFKFKPNIKLEMLFKKSVDNITFNVSELQGLSNEDLKIVINFILFKNNISPQTPYLRTYFNRFDKPLVDKNNGSLNKIDVTNIDLILKVLANE